MTDTASRPYRRRWLYAPFAILALLAAAWTGVWFYASSRVEALLDAWMEREASHGRSYNCASRTVSGYPFRIEVRCDEPTATLQADEPVVLKARGLRAVAQAYQPDHVIVEASGPMTVSTVAGAGLYVADWTLLQASLRGRPTNPQRVSLVVDGPKLDRTAADGGGPVAGAQRLEAHLRRRPDPNANDAGFDLAARLVAATVALAPALGDRPIEAEATGILRGVNDFRPKPWPQRLRDWQAAGGRLEIVSARFQQGDALAVAQGDVGLNGQGRLDGAVNLTLAGLDQVVPLILGQSGSGRTQAGLMAGLRMLGRAELEGKRAIAVPLAFRDGRVFFGPIPVAQTGPLF